MQCAQVWWMQKVERSLHRTDMRMRVYSDAMCLVCFPRESPNAW